MFYSLEERGEGEEGPQPNPKYNTLYSLTINIYMNARSPFHYL